MPTFSMLRTPTTTSPVSTHKVNKCQRTLPIAAIQGSYHTKQTPLSTVKRVSRRSMSLQPTRRAIVSPTQASASPEAGADLSPELKSAIEQFISENKVIVFMKGTKLMPMCGFSNTVVQILNTLNAPFVSVNILEDDLLRAGMKEYSAWPTFPQVYIDGEFYGGCDIMIAAYQSGELQESLEAALNS